MKIRICFLDFKAENGSFRPSFRTSTSFSIRKMVLTEGKKPSDSTSLSSFSEIEVWEPRKEKGKVCFGSGLERKTMYSDTRGLVSRHARKFLKRHLDIAPGMYEISSATSALSAQLNKPTSKLGTVLGGRKAERKFYDIEDTPAPGEYNLPSFPREIVKSCIPFNSTTERVSKTSNVPGVGTYRLEMYKRRRIEFKHSLGGRKCLQPSVKTKCGPFNFDKCEICQKNPEGDYWYMDVTAESSGAKTEGIFLCRPCYDIEKKENKIFNFSQMQRFKKIRDCSKIHFHDGCKGKLFIVPPQEIEKLKEREAYLSLYFN